MKKGHTRGITRGLNEYTARDMKRRRAPVGRWERSPSRGPTWASSKAIGTSTSGGTAPSQTRWRRKWRTWPRKCFISDMTIIWNTHFPRTSWTPLTVRGGDQTCSTRESFKAVLPVWAGRHLLVIYMLTVLFKLWYLHVVCHHTSLCEQVELTPFSLDSTDKSKSGIQVSHQGTTWGSRGFCHIRMCLITSSLPSV